MAGMKKERKESSYFKLSKQLYTAVLPAYGVDPSLLNRCWFENYNGDYEGIFKDSVLGVLEDVIQIFKGRVSPQALMAFFGKDPHTTELWSFYASRASKCNDVLVLFIVGRTPWIMTSAVRAAKNLRPRIMVPVSGQSPVFIMPVELYIQECS
jgi:hypothetical protein